MLTHNSWQLKNVFVEFLDFQDIAMQRWRADGVSIIILDEKWKHLFSWLPWGPNGEILWNKRMWEDASWTKLSDTVSLSYSPPLPVLARWIVAPGSMIQFRSLAHARLSEGATATNACSALLCSAPLCSTLLCSGCLSSSPLSLTSGSLLCCSGCSPRCAHQTGLAGGDLRVSPSVFSHLFGFWYLFPCQSPQPRIIWINVKEKKSQGGGGG